MKKAEVLIIGAGAAGLMAAYTLCKAGRKVVVLEACNHLGGRIYTIQNTLFFHQAELGAEFVHGQLPLTLQLLEEAGIGYHQVDGEMWQYQGGKFSKDAAMIENWPLLMKKLKGLSHDMTLDSFLDTHFTDVKFDELKDSVRRYVVGYDTGDPAKASALSLRNEWMSEDDEHQYRIDEGYCALINFLAAQCKAADATVYLNAPVSHLTWQKGKVQACTTENECYEAERVVIAIPLGVWQAPASAKGYIRIEPEIEPQQAALKELGFGAVIKILLQFKSAFWDEVVTEELAGHSLKNMGFLFTDEAIPTWWTQKPGDSTLLTGWLGGPEALKWKGADEAGVFELAVQSLSNIFNRSADALKDQLIGWHVANWSANDYTYGSYAYDTVNTEQALMVLKEPVNDTLYFAGEFMYQGPSMGTVEAALLSGKETAEKILTNK